MSKTELQSAASETTKEIVNTAESFTNSLMGKAFKPLVNSLIRYIKITNQRISQLEGELNGK